MADLRETTSQLASKSSAVLDKAEEFGRKTADRIDQARAGTADALHSAASTVRSGGAQSAEKIGRLAAHTADTLDSTAGYVEEHDVKGVAASLRQALRHNLGPSLLVAAAVGFWAGAVFRGAVHRCHRD